MRLAPLHELPWNLELPIRVGEPRRPRDDDKVLAHRKLQEREPVRRGATKPA